MAALRGPPVVQVGFWPGTTGRYVRAGLFQESPERALLTTESGLAEVNGHWLISFEDNSARAETRWVRSELERTGLPPRRWEDVGPQTAPPARREQRLGERVRGKSLREPIPDAKV
ncbi:hypothetical protein GCM10010300_79290 [Streptomyces olivaceoviridis]|nr:hypothetical protein GCM10010300_79290 [Streptomyces olivaceoviridis]